MLPIVLRVLYGRLRAAKRGKKDGGKGAIHAKRTLILHQLMDLSEDHLRYFFDLWFEELYSGADLQGRSIYEYILEGGTAPEKNMKLLQACIEMIQAILHKLGSLMNKNLDYILQTIVWIGFVVTSQSSSKAVGYKAVRNSVYSQISAFFSKFVEFSYSARAEEAVYHTFVWRPLENFDKDYIHSPSGVLQLVLCWSKEPRYWRYLQSAHPVQGFRLLENIVKVLLKSTTAGKVVDCVLEVFNNLVTPLETMETEANSFQEIGVKTALQELDSLLLHFDNWIKASNKDVKQLRKVGVKLDILTHLAPHISKPTVALEFLNQLFVMLNSIKKPESVSKVLVITQYLVDRVEEGQLSDIVELAVPFFGKLSSRQERTELSNFMRRVRERAPALRTLCDVCINLNAFDRRRFEEPDFEARMQEFIRIRDGLRKEVDMSLPELRAVFYNCSFFLQHETDSSLKTNTLDTLLLLCLGIKRLGDRDIEAARKFINKVCLEQIKRGIKSKEDTVR